MRLGMLDFILVKFLIENYNLNLKIRVFFIFFKNYQKKSKYND